jgi:hypothetical protein
MLDERLEDLIARLVAQVVRLGVVRDSGKLRWRWTNLG